MTDAAPNQAPVATPKPAKDRGRKAIEKKNKVLEKLQIEYIPVDTLKPNSYNPNRQSEHDFELLCASMKEDGFTQPVVCLKDLTIVDGEHRWRAARQLGFTEIPVVKVDMTPEQMRISTLRHNRARGSEDMELTAALMRDLRELGALDWAQDSLMMDDAEMNKLLEDVPAPEALAAEEYSEAWRLSTGESLADQNKALDSAGLRRSDSTAQAADALRAAEKRIQAAKTEEERAAAVRDANIFQLSVTFAGDEAKLVKEALGKRPAETILDMCRAKVAAAAAPPASTA